MKSDQRNDWFITIYFYNKTRIFTNHTALQSRFHPLVVAIRPSCGRFRRTYRRAGIAVANAPSEPSRRERSNADSETSCGRHDSRARCSRLHEGAGRPGSDAAPGSPRRCQDPTRIRQPAATASAPLLRAVTHRGKRSRPSRGVAVPPVLVSL